MTLHVTNGDSAVGIIRAVDAQGEVLPWRDVLHDGPVPGGLGAGALAAERARFLGALGWAGEAEVRRSFTVRDATLARAADFDEVVLWFEHDLYDQLQLIQVLDRLCCLVPAPRALSLVCEAEYLGQMTPARARDLFGARRPVTGMHSGVARLAWGAFTAPDPGVLTAALGTDLSALPFLRAALLRVLEEYPWTRDGLARSERQALEAVADGAATREAAFAHQWRREEPVYLGDASFYSYVDRLCAGRVPLLARADNELSLTDAGHAVLAGASDAVRLNAIDRWIGGVHLSGAEAPWRWDSRSRVLVSAGL